MLFGLLLVILAATPVPAQFTNPSGFEREVLTVGDVQSIEYETEFPEYTIALWQKNPSQDTARRGPILLDAGRKGTTSFNWEVQVYDFDVDDSNVFFLWMFEGDASMQGNMSSLRMSSSYFNITSKLTPTASTLTTPAVSPTLSTSDDTSTRPASTSLAGPVAQEDKDEQEGGERDGSFSALPAGVQAGIGVGIGAVVVTCIVWTFILWLYLRRRRQAEMPAAAPEQNIPGQWKPAPRLITRTRGRDMPVQTTSPIELW